MILTDTTFDFNNVLAENTQYIIIICICAITFMQFFCNQKLQIYYHLCFGL